METEKKLTIPFKAVRLQPKVKQRVTNIKNYLRAHTSELITEGRVIEILTSLDNERILEIYKEYILNL